MSLRPCLDILQVEAKKVMSFDDVRIALLDHPHQLAQHLGIVIFLSRNQPFPSRGIGQRNRGDPVALSQRVRKLKARLAVGFDINL